MAPLIGRYLLNTLLSFNSSFFSPFYLILDLSRKSYNNFYFSCSFFFFGSNVVGSSSGVDYCFVLHSGSNMIWVKNGSHFLN